LTVCFGDASLAILCGDAGQPKLIERGEETVSEGRFDGLQWRAVALGVVVDHVSTLIFSTMLVAIAATEDFFSKDPAVAEAARTALAESPSFMLSILLGGAICTVLAAFIGSRYAADRFVLHGIWIAVVSAAMVLVIDSGLDGSLSSLEALGWLVVLPAGWLGGTLARWAAEQQLADEGDTVDD
jgi:hypothetical protein